jgi:hypothetical protein
MISPAIATAEIRRLSATTNYHLRKPEALQELVDTLAQYAPSAPKAHAVIDQWLAENRMCATPADLRDLLRGEAENEPVQRMSSGCAACEGTGFVIQYYLCTRTEAGLLRQRLAGWQEAADVCHSGAYHGRPLSQSQSVGEFAARCACTAVSREPQ